MLGGLYLIPYDQCQEPKAEQHNQGHKEGTAHHCEVNLQRERKKKRYRRTATCLVTYILCKQEHGSHAKPWGMMVLVMSLELQFKAVWCWQKVITKGNFAGVTFLRLTQ